MTSPVVETDSVAELRRAIATIRSNKSAMANLPQEVQNWCGDLVALVRTGGIVSAVGSLGITTAIDESVVIPKIWGYRDDINHALGETWKKLDEMDPGLEVPVTFLKFADEWRNIKGDIDNAGNSFSETDLRGNWTGDAANRFWAMRDRQKTAFTSMSEMCETVATNLEDVAEAELKLYADLATHTRDLVEKVTALVGSFLGSFFNLPWGPVSTLGDVAAAVLAAKGFILDVSTAVADSAFANTKAANTIAQAASVQAGIPGNVWPPGAVAYPGSSPNDKERITEAIGDASTQDGDKSDWSIGSS
ncbi:WXG100 family type VII secretion target [Nocardia sp. X0981]